MFVPSRGHAPRRPGRGPDAARVRRRATGVLRHADHALHRLLRAIHYGWRQELIAESSAPEIAETGRELHRRLAVFAEPFAKVGRQLGSAVTAYNDAVNVDRRVVPQLRHRGCRSIFGEAVALIRDD